jgi:hypothetical protein
VAGTACSRWFLARGYLYPENGGDIFLRNVGFYYIYTVLHPRRRNSSIKGKSKENKSKEAGKGEEMRKQFSEGSSRR